MSLQFGTVVDELGEDKMNLTDIPRVKVGAVIPKKQVAVLDPVAQERSTLATRASDLLGYRVLAADVSGTPVHTLEKLGKLGEALLANDIEILDTVSVIRYQHEEVRRRTQERTDEMLRNGELENWVTGWNAGQSFRWSHSEIGAYYEPIPEFVLNKAVLLKEAIPEVSLYIIHLDEPKADPFLVAKFGKELYFIEVWDEPRFEGRVTR